MPAFDLHRLENAYRMALAALLAQQSPEGPWVGELCTSALSTATATSALAVVQKATPAHGSFDSLITAGLDWLIANQNADGGWGDTVRSFSNISTTMLGRAAFHLTGAADRCREPLQRAEAWLQERHGKTPEALAEAVRQRYGKDRTFSVPILMTSALAGLVGWSEVPPLPFELACLPQLLYRFLRLPVVSYALPALIAIGQAVFHHRPPRNPLTRLLRRAATAPSLRVLERIQPAGGGFLEAAPLTSFVTLGLASTGNGNHPVVSRCVEFLCQSVRPDGSWPIDTNLSTWVTTLAINALAAAGELDRLPQRESLRKWLQCQQFTHRHPYTGAEPGGWAWTPLSGGVPDADDTPGALLALTHLGNSQPHTLSRGLRWLAGQQNRDGGMPTFCHGWGRLPFDRSGPDLTAHVLRALAPWCRSQAEKGLSGITDLLKRLHTGGLSYLARTQRSDGSWLPLWFGNQHARDEENPTYGTARVLAAYRDLQLLTTRPARRGIAWLGAAQNPDGGWGAGRGTPSSIEETSLAVEVLLDSMPAARDAVRRGLAWLIEKVEAGGLDEPTPIGFYFAKLWYFEKLYPIVFAVAALGRARRLASTL
jgi:squalene-hopene/tetraprenyl-beta-curcumene cyclase